MPDEYETELQKYNNSNSLAKLVLNNYIKKVSNIIKEKSPKKLLDAGCGLGFLMKEISKDIDSELYGLDILQNSVEYAKNLCPNAKISQGSVYNLPFENDSFDVVLFSEVLEHLDKPEQAIYELKRVSSNYCIVCVPYEPFFSITNFMRLKYWSSWGNYPGHIQKWNKSSFKKLLLKYFTDVKVKQSSIWIIGVCKK